MEDSDLGMVMAESLMDQFHTVRAEVNLSQVCMFGDQEIASHYNVAEFQVLFETGGRRNMKPFHSGQIILIYSFRY